MYTLHFKSGVNLSEEYYQHLCHENIFFFLKWSDADADFDLDQELYICMLFHTKQLLWNGKQQCNNEQIYLTYVYSWVS